LQNGTSTSATAGDEEEEDEDEYVEEDDDESPTSPGLLRDATYENSDDGEYAEDDSDQSTAGSLKRRVDEISEGSEEKGSEAAKKART
jgi:hypothetical protein